MQALTRDNFIKTTSRQKRSARTVLLRMAADQERADRIRQVRIDNHLRWKQIAAYVGVEMRSAQMWQETGAISWDNARKFAELAGVDPHWLMSGAETSTPDLFAVGDGSIEDQLADMNKLIAEQSRALREQAAVLGELRDAVRELRETVATQQTAAQELDAAARRIAATPTPGDASQPPARAPKATAKTSSRRASN